MNDKTLNMKLPTALYEDIQKLALEKNISLSSLVRMVLTEYVNANK